MDNPLARLYTYRKKPAVPIWHYKASHFFLVFEFRFFNIKMVDVKSPACVEYTFYNYYIHLRSLMCTLPVRLMTGAT